MTVAEEAYAAGIWALAVLEKRGLDETPAAEAIRDELDLIWLLLSEESQEAIRNYSEELAR